MPAHVCGDLFPGEAALDSAPLVKRRLYRSMPKDAVAACITTKAGYGRNIQEQRRGLEADHRHITGRKVAVKMPFMQSFSDVGRSVFGVSLCENPG